MRWDKNGAFSRNEARDAEAYVTSDAAAIAVDWQLQEAAGQLNLIAQVLNRRAEQMALRYEQTEGVSESWEPRRLGLLGEAEALGYVADAVEGAIECVALMRFGEAEVEAAIKGSASGRAVRLAELALRPGYSREMPEEDEAHDSAE